MAQALPHKPAVSRGLMLGSAAVIAGTLALASLGHRAPLDPATAGSRPLAERELRFADRADGAVVVTDARSGAMVMTLPPGSEGFVRGAMRGLVRERNRESLGMEAPFHLAAWPDGRLTLEDTATGLFMELHAFGRTNAEAFLRLLSTEE
ncbi:MAG TPA: photosynthetic complex assembly protein PuhC [Falsiroseomonas sp.]|jgi:putative photosynthetic complex assembly protein|nr:photosynthetic complex assembly protein PuhC [Falsiroseomonas sp.]